MSGSKPAAPTLPQITAFAARVSPLKFLSPESRERIVRAASPLPFRRKEVLFLQGSPARSAWMLYSGRIGLMIETRSGRRQELEHIIPGELFGTLDRLFGHAKTYSSTAEATAESIALRIPDGLFKSAFSGDVELMSKLLGLCADRLAKMTELPRMSMEPPRTRLAFALSRLVRVYGNRIPIKEREIADIAGIAPETAYRTLHEFRECKFISPKRQHVEVLNPERIHAVWEDAPVPR